MVEDGLEAFDRPVSTSETGETNAVAVAMAGIARSAFTYQDWEALDADAYAPLGVAGGLGRIEEKLSAISDLARDNDGEVWLLAYPWPAQLVHESTELDWPAHLYSVCQQIGCAGVIDTFPAFTQHRDINPDWYETLFLNNDVHYSTAGNALVFSAVLEAVGR